MVDGHYSFYQDAIKVFEAYSIYAAILFAVLITGYKYWQKYKTLFGKNDNFIFIHSEIHEMLTELRVLTDSARAQIIQFHNGEYFMDGVSMRKFSVTHESLEKGIDSDALCLFLY
jgi:hypothetical protein